MDLALAGCPVIGKFCGYKSGHTLNSQLLCELMLNQHGWHYTTMEHATEGWKALMDTGSRRPLNHFDRGLKPLRQYHCVVIAALSNRR